MEKQEQITQGCSPALQVFCKDPPDSSSLAQIIGITKEKSTYDSREIICSSDSVAGKDSPGMNKDDNSVLARIGGNGGPIRNSRSYSSITGISLAINQNH